MSRRFVRNIEPNIKEMVQQDECGCAQRIAPWLAQTGVAPCVDPLLSGALAINGDCELGTNGAYLPGQFESLTASEKALGITQSNNFAATYDSFKWSTTDARSGTKSIELQDYATIGGGPHYLFPITGEACSDASYWSQPFNYGARVVPGSIVSFAFWAKTYDTLGNAGIARMSFEWHNDQGGYIGAYNANNNVDFTSSWVQYSISAAAPANSYYVSAWARLGNSFANGLSYIDDFTLSVA